MATLITFKRIAMTLPKFIFTVMQITPCTKHPPKTQNFEQFMQFTKTYTIPTFTYAILCMLHNFQPFPHAIHCKLHNCVTLHTRKGTLLEFSNCLIYYQLPQRINVNCKAANKETWQRVSTDTSEPLPLNSNLYSIYGDVLSMHLKVESSEYAHMYDHYHNHSMKPKL
jgi:hypothetical protein